MWQSAGVNTSSLRWTLDFWVRLARGSYAEAILPELRETDDRLDIVWCLLLLARFDPSVTSLLASKDSRLCPCCALRSSCSYCLRCTSGCAHSCTSAGEIIFDITVCALGVVTANFVQKSARIECLEVSSRWFAPSRWNETHAWKERRNDDSRSCPC